MSLGIGILGSIYYSVTCLTAKANGDTINNSLPWWANLLIAITPTIIGFLLDLIVKKGWLSKKTSDDIKEVVEDITDDLKDDGKLNGSNKEKDDNGK